MFTQLLSLTSLMNLSTLDTVIGIAMLVLVLVHIILISFVQFAMRLLYRYQLHILRSLDKIASWVILSSYIVVMLIVFTLIFTQQ